VSNDNLIIFEMCLDSLEGVGDLATRAVSASDLTVRRVNLVNLTPGRQNSLVRRVPLHRMTTENQPITKMNNTRPWREHLCFGISRFVVRAPRKDAYNVSVLLGWRISLQISLAKSIGNPSPMAGTVPASNEPLSRKTVIDRNKCSSHGLKRWADDPFH
jgi:hypothetical protein